MSPSTAISPVEGSTIQTSSATTLRVLRSRTGISANARGGSQVVLSGGVFGTRRARELFDQPGDVVARGTGHAVNMETKLAGVAVDAELDFGHRSVADSKFHDAALGCAAHGSAQPL